MDEKNKVDGNDEYVPDNQKSYFEIDWVVPDFEKRLEWSSEEGSIGTEFVAFGEFFASIFFF